MGQRVFFIVIEPQAPATEPVAWPFAKARVGQLLPEGDVRAALLKREFFTSLAAAKKAFCAIGGKWLPVLPRYFQGLALAPSASGWRVRPASRNNGLKPLLSGLSTNLEVAAWAMLNEPWDLFALWLTLDNRAPAEPLHKELNALIGSQSMDVVIAVVCLGDSGGQWAWRLSAGGGAELPACSPHSILPTILSVLGVGPPPGLAGVPVDLAVAAKASGYTAAEEQTIQQRLEDLGYL